MLGLCQTDRQTDMQAGRQADFAVPAHNPWNTGQTRSPPEVPGWSKITTVMTN